jgi:hypothetical protein
MRSFAQLDRVIGQVPSSVVRTLRLVDTGRGSEALHRDQLPGLLSHLAQRARVESITASSAIEGVVVSDTSRADRIIAGRAKTLRTRSEQELAGYRDAQDYLLQVDWRPLNLGLLLHLHKLLFAHTAAPGGRFKTEDNLVVDRSPNGDVTVRFRPVPAADTEFHLAELIERYRAASSADELRGPGCRTSSASSRTPTRRSPIAPRPHGRTDPSRSASGSMSSTTHR